VRLIGMLDSPYVRRVAVSLRVMGVPFVHQALSVFRDFDAFAAVNPVVKAPTFVADNGVVLMDSTLILDHVQSLVPFERQLMPLGSAERAGALHVNGLALAACDKSVQMVYELNLRPVEKRHQPWLDRVRGQILAAYGLLERGVDSGEVRLGSERLTLADITVAVAWRFTQDLLPNVVPSADHPGLAAFSAEAEERPEFLAFPPN
jgi:glutathione S-transferase